MLLASTKRLCLLEILLKITIGTVGNFSLYSYMYSRVSPVGPSSLTRRNKLLFFSKLWFYFRLLNQRVIDNADKLGQAVGFILSVGKRELFQTSGNGIRTCGWLMACIGSYLFQKFNCKWLESRSRDYRLDSARLWNNITLCLVIFWVFRRDQGWKLLQYVDLNERFEHLRCFKSSIY